jgi:hypothetical protein
VPLVVIPLALVLILIMVLVLVPLGVIRRYRSGTARRLARPWLAAFNAAVFGVSVALLLASATLIGFWAPGAIAAALKGTAIGAALGIVGLALARWETRGPSLFYTPNRWLILAITLVVVIRISLTLWRAGQAWQMRDDRQSWLAEAGVAGSLAAGAVAITYYLIFWCGVWLRARRRHGRNG